MNGGHVRATGRHRIRLMVDFTLYFLRGVRGASRGGLASRQAVPSERPLFFAAGGARRGLILLRPARSAGSAALRGLGPAPGNSLRARRPLRSNSPGESVNEARQGAPGPRPSIPAAPEIAPTGHRLPRANAGCCSSRQRQPLHKGGIGRAASHRSNAGTPAQRAGHLVDAARPARSRLCPA